MRCKLIGEKLGHSFSKDIHDKLGRYDYEHVELAADEVKPFLEARCFDGLNVTMPYKETVIPYLDDISDLARDIGAVNTIVNKDGKLIGYNTDFGGMTSLIGHMGIDLSGKKVIIAGSGGTSRTAAMACRSLNASDIIRVSRSGRKGAVTYEEMYSLHSDAALLINTTPVGMYPDLEATSIDIGRFKSPEGVLDVVYNPLKSKLILAAEEAGIPASNGLYMLTEQAMLAAEIFTGERVAEGTAERIYNELTAEKRNIVLTGMPGSGKTTLGKLLSDRLGRYLVETDDEVIAAAHMPVTEIFAAYGEKHFRDLESEAIRKASSKLGSIISTGGGAILRKENVDALKMNGIVVFLDRPLADLLPTDDRPLANDADKIRQLYEDRYSLYRKAADVTVKIEGTEEDSAKDIRRAVSWK